jgi:hypothetical protein
MYQELFYKIQYYIYHAKPIGLSLANPHGTREEGDASKSPVGFTSSLTKFVVRLPLPEECASPGFHVWCKTFPTGHPVCRL